MNIITAANSMLDTGKFYACNDLAKLFGVSESRAQCWLNSIVKDKRFKTDVNEATGQVKVITIDNRKRSIDKLQNSVLLMKRPNV